LFSLTGFSSVDPSSGEADFNVVGITVGVGASIVPVTLGGYYTNSKPKSDMGECYTGRGGVKSNGC